MAAQQAARNTGQAEAAALSARLLDAVRREERQLVSAQPRPCRPMHGLAADVLINAADAALLDGKGHGKHRFSVAA